MNPNFDENKLQQLFRDQREADVRRAPPFARTVAAARAHSRPQPVLWRLAIVSAAVIALGAGASFFLHHAGTSTSERFVASAPVILITQWQSPTDFLLESSSQSDVTGTVSEKNP